MIDRVVQEPGPDAVARCRSASSGSRRGCSTARFCFGGEESAGASFLRRDGTVWTTDKDGPILDLLAAEITRPHRQGPRRALPGADGAVRHAALHADRRAGHARAEGAAGEARSPEAVKAADAGRRADHGQADAGAGQQRPHRRAEGRRRRAAGSRPGRPAPKTSTRSTPRASATRPTWTPSSPRRRRSSTEALRDPEHRSASE